MKYSHCIKARALNGSTSYFLLLVILVFSNVSLSYAQTEGLNMMFYAQNNKEHIDSIVEYEVYINEHDTLLINSDRIDTVPPSTVEVYQKGKLLREVYKDKNGRTRLISRNTYRNDTLISSLVDSVYGQKNTDTYYEYPSEHMVIAHNDKKFEGRTAVVYNCDQSRSREIFIDGKSDTLSEIQFIRNEKGVTRVFDSVSKNGARMSIFTSLDRAGRPLTKIKVDTAGVIRTVETFVYPDSSMVVSRELNLDNYTTRSTHTKKFFDAYGNTYKSYVKSKYREDR